MDGATMSAGGGGYEIASGYVTVGVDLEPARQEIAQFKGELANLFQGGMTIGAGMGSYGAGGTQFSAPAGGMSAVGNTIGIGGGMSAQKIEIDTSQAQQSVQQLTGSVKELKDQLSLLETAAAGFTSRGAAVPSNIATEIAGLRSQLGGGGAIAPAGGGMSAPAGRPFHVPAYLPMEEMYAAAPAAMGLGEPEAFEAPVTRTRSGGWERVFDSLYTRQLRSRLASQLDAMDEIEAPADETAGIRSRALSALGRGGRRGGRAGGFGINGALARATGIPYAGVIAGFMAVDAIAGVAEAGFQTQDVLSHATDSLIQYDAYGSAFRPADSPQMLANAHAAAGIEAENIWWQTAGSIPLVGRVAGAFDTGKYGRQRRLQRLGYQDSLIASGQQAALESPATLAAAVGDPVGVAQARGDAQAAIAAANYGRFYDQFGSQAAATQQAGVVWDQVQAAATANVAHARAAETARIAGVGGSIFAAQFGTLAAQSQSAAAGFSTYDDVSALRATRAGLVSQQAGEEATFNAGTQAYVAGALNDPERQRRQERRDSEFTEMRAKAKAALDEIDAEIANRVSAHNAGASEIYFQSRMGVYAQQEASRLGGLAFNRDIALGQGYVAASGLSAARDTFGAAMANLAARENAAQYIPGALQRGMELGNLGADRSRLEAEHRFSMAVEGEGLTARSAAAQAEMGLEPLNAQAMTDVARARHEIAMAPPELRAQTQSTVAAELRAHQQLLTAQRGGEVAIDMSLAQAAGTPTAMGMDLTGRLRDTLAAGKTYENGIGNLGSSPDASKTVNVSDKEVSDALKQLVTLFQKLKPTSVTMFQN